MQVEYLADRVQLIPELARLHFEEWSYLRPGETLEGRTKRLRRSCGKGLPTVIVGLLNNELCGSAMLVAQDLEACPRLTPWLAGVYIKPQYRNKGLAVELIARIIEEARALHFPHLYLYTPGNTRLYEHLGWAVHEHHVHHGTQVVVMSRRLA